MLQRSLAVGAVFLGLLTIGIYLPSIQGGFIWDDFHNISQNTTLRTLEGLRRIWAEPWAVIQYYPLTYTSFWVEFHLWKSAAAGYHGVNVLLHSLNAVLLWLALKRLGIAGAWLAAAVFAIHPVQVESVAWITERKNVLSAFFYLYSLHAYIRFADLDNAQTTEQDRQRAYMMAVGLFICALLSKSATCTLPVAILILLWWKRDSIGWSDIRPLILMVILAVAMGLTTMWVERGGSAMGEEWGVSFVERCLIAARAVAFYAWKLIWPADLTFIYPRWQPEDRFWWQYLLLWGGVSGLAALWHFRNRIGKAPMAAALFYIVTLWPSLGFVDFYFMRYSFVADRFQYMASISPIALGVSILHGRLKPLSVVLLLVLGTLTWQQQQIYRDEQTIWRATVRNNPQAWMAHNNLGNALARNGNLEEAVVQFSEALRIRPSHQNARINLANALARQGKIDAALGLFAEALSMDSGNADLHYNMGTVLSQTGRTEEASRHWTEAIRINPEHAEAHNNLGIALIREGKIKEAIIHFSEALRIRPEFAKARENLDRAVADLERRTGAVEP